MSLKINMKIEQHLREVSAVQSPSPGILLCQCPTGQSARPGGAVGKTRAGGRIRIITLTSQRCRGDGNMVSSSSSRSSRDTDTLTLSVHWVQERPWSNKIRVVTTQTPSSIQKCHSSDKNTQKCLIRAP